LRTICNNEHALIAQNLDFLNTETIEFMIMWFDNLLMSYIFSL